MTTIISQMTTKRIQRKIGKIMSDADRLERIIMELIDVIRTLSSNDERIDAVIAGFEASGGEEE